MCYMLIEVFLKARYNQQKSFVIPDEGDEKMKNISEKHRFFDCVYQEMCPHLMRYALASIKDPDLAEDVVQDVFRIAWTRIDVFMTSPNYKGWLINTLKYVLRDYQRAKVKYISLISKLLASQAYAKHGARMELSVDMLYEDMAGSEDLMLLKRLYLEDQTMKEIAATDGISVEACKKRVQRARARLKEYIQTHGYV